MKIETSNGDILDKYSILIIKRRFVKSPEKIKNIDIELELLRPIFEDLCKIDKIRSKFDELVTVNKKIWHIEDSIRKKEEQKSFDDEFIQLARGVYINNDERARIKKEINVLTNSVVIEEKEYVKYDN